MSFLSDRYHFKHAYKRVAAYLFDALGAFLFAASRPTQPLDTAKLKRVLFVRLDQIGDIAMAVPAMRAFKDAFPDVLLDVLTSTEGQSLLKQEPWIHQVLVFENHWFRQSPLLARIRELRQLKQKLKANHYDAAVDFRGDLRMIHLMTRCRIPERIGYSMTGGGFWLTRVGRYWKDMHQVDLNRALLGFFGMASVEASAVPFSVRDDESQVFWGSLGRDIPRGSKPLIVMHGGAGRVEKTWETAKFRRLSERILKDRLGHLVFIGTEAERGVIGVVHHAHAALTDLRGKTSLRDLLVLLKAADVFIGGDSGPAHLAAAQGARVVSIFKGPNAPEVWHPWTRKLYLVMHPKPCPACGSNECLRKNKNCLETLSARQVYQAVIEAWRDSLASYPIQPSVQPSLEEF